MFFRKVGNFFRSVGGFLYCFRGFFMAIPVVVLALLLAKYNAEHLGEQVGLFLSRDGSFSMVISRAKAVQWPLYLTGGTILLTWLSRKPFYPWIVSIVTLVVPVYLLLLNQLF